LAEPAGPSVIIQPHQYWTESMTSEKNLETLRQRGLLLDRLVYEWTATQGESHLTPDTNQIMVFTAHCECGFGVYPSKFLQRVCTHYGIEIARMLPNTIAMLSIFTFLCEAWLGVKPYLDLWRYFYSGVYHSSKFFIGLVGFSEKRRRVYPFSD